MTVQLFLHCCNAFHISPIYREGGNNIGAYYSGIILYSFCSLLFSKLFQHNPSRPTWLCETKLTIFSIVYAFLFITESTKSFPSHCHVYTLSQDCQSYFGVSGYSNMGERKEEDGWIGGTYSPWDMSGLRYAKILWLAGYVVAPGHLGTLH